MSIEQEVQSPGDPTTLNLFPLLGRKYIEVADYYLAGAKLDSQYINAERSFDRLIPATETRQERLDQTIAELSNRAVARIEAASAGAAFLQIFDELSEKGVSSPEIYDFYKRCLIVNTRFFALLHQEPDAYLRQSILFVEKGHGSVSTKPMQALERMIDVEEKMKPIWFSENSRDWRIFLLRHAVFANYLKGFFIKYPDFPQPLLPIFLTPYPLGRTSQDNLPEWLNTDGSIPERSLVASELLADLEEEIQSAKMAETSERQYISLRAIIDEKSLKSLRYFQLQRKKIFPEVTNFTKAIIFLYFSRYWPDYTVDPFDVSASIDKIQEEAIPADKAQKKRIETLSESKHILRSTESFALWIEKMLQEGKIIESTQDLINDDRLSLLDALFDEVRPDGSKEGFKALRDTNKKAFQKLNYEINPLLEILNADEIQHLQELTRELKGSLIEPVIWEMAILISTRMQSQDFDIHNASKQTQIVLGHMQQFLKSWLGTNYSWAIMKLHESFREKGKQIEGGEETADSHAIPTNHQTVTPSETLEVEEEIEELQRGILSGWHIYYTTDHRTNNSKSLVKIGNDTSTATERENQFIQFVGENGIPCTVKPASIIRSLEVVVMTPSEVEWTRMGMKVNGESFKKYKHPMGMRTLYIMDPAKKEIIFFIYKKKDWKYRF